MPKFLQVPSSQMWGLLVQNQIKLVNKSAWAIFAFFFTLLKTFYRLNNMTAQQVNLSRYIYEYGSMLTLGKESWLSSSCRFLMILSTRVLEANGSHRIIDRSLKDRQSPVSRVFLCWLVILNHPHIAYPRTCSCPFLTPSRKPCSSLARLPSTNFSRMQASKHQVNYHRNTQQKYSKKKNVTQSTYRITC